MERSKRQESSIIIYFSFYSLLLLVLIIFTFNVLYPRISIIEWKKDSTKSTYEWFLETKEQGLNYSEFISMKSKLKLTTYQEELFNNIEEEFYQNYLTNTTNELYSKFLENQLLEINNDDKKEEFAKKEEKIINILPPYSESNVNWANNLLSDFKFINYIENLFATFSLEYTNEIGISQIHLVEEFSETDNKSSLDTNIYYIPLTLWLEGTKYNMINFLYYIEHVWNINIQENEINIHNQNTDNFLYRTVKILLKNDIPTASNYTQNFIENYNIFENQLIDIESIEFREYLDESEISHTNETQSLATRVKENQANDKMTIDIKLRFYIKWVQNIKIIEHLNSYINYFNTTKLLVANQMWNKDLSNLELSRVKAIQSDINEMNSWLSDISVAIAKQENFNSVLKDVTNYTNILDSMHGKIGYNFYILYFINEYNKLLENKDNKDNNPRLYSYLLEIESDIEWLNKSDVESKVSYYNRLNNKKLFENIIQIQKNIELKK